MFPGPVLFATSFRAFPCLRLCPTRSPRWALRLPSHPSTARLSLIGPRTTGVTLGTSGLFTAGTAVLLLVWARAGLLTRRACLIGLAYGLATPAYVYATLAVGHQASAFALFASFFLLSKQETPARLLPRVHRGVSGGLRGRDRASGGPGGRRYWVSICWPSVSAASGGPMHCRYSRSGRPSDPDAR